jgi:hypothetical protein
VTTPGEWRADVLARHDLHERTKVILFAMAEHMQPDGTIKVERKVIGELLGLPVQRITDRLPEAIAAGFLTISKKGGYGRPTEYTTAVRWSPQLTQPPGHLEPQLTQPPGHLQSGRPQLTQPPGHLEDLDHPVTDTVSRSLPKVTTDSNHSGGAPSGATEALVPMDESPIIPSPEPLAPRHLTAPRTGPDYEQERQRQLAELEQLIAQEKS